MDYLSRLKNQREQKNGNSTGPGGHRVLRDIMPRSKPVVIGKKRTALEKLETEKQAPQRKGAPAPQRREAAESPAAKAEKPVPQVVSSPDLPIRTWEPASPPRRIRTRTKLTLWTAGVILLLAFILPTVAFPKFSIAVYPKIEIVPIGTVALSGDTTLTEPNSSQRSVPALVVTVERTLQQQYDATGKKFIQTRAHGTVTITNAYSSAPQTLVANTRIQDPSGKIFHLTKTITIPGAEITDGKIVPKSISTSVVADGIGQAYNIGPTEFRIPGFRGTAKYDGFSAKSDIAFDGGFEGEAKVVLPDDLKRASEDITRRAVDALRSDLQLKIPSGDDFLVPEGGRETVIVSINQPKAGDRFDQFPVSVTARGRLFVVRRSHVLSVLADALIPKTSDLAVSVTPQQTNLTISGGHIGPGTGHITFDASGELTYYHQPNTQDITSTLRGSTPQKAEAYLRGQNEIDSFRVKRFPFWLWFIPGRDGGLEVTVTPPQG